MVNRAPSVQEFLILSALVNLNGRRDWTSGLSYSALAKLTGIRPNNLNKPLRRLLGRRWVQRAQGGWRLDQSALEPVVQAMVKNPRWRVSWVCSEFNEYVCRNRGQDGVLLSRLVARILCGLPWTGNPDEDALRLQRIAVPEDIASNLHSALLARDLEGVTKRLVQGQPPTILRVLPRGKARFAGNALATSPSFFVECVRSAPLRTDFHDGGVRIHLPGDGGGRDPIEGELWLVIERLALLCQLGDEATGTTLKSRVLRLEGGDHRPDQVLRTAEEMRSLMEEGTRLFGGARASISVCDLHLEAAREFFRRFRHEVEPASDGECFVTINYPDGSKRCARLVAWRIVAAAGAFDAKSSNWKVEGLTKELNAQGNSQVDKVPDARTKR